MVTVRRFGILSVGAVSGILYAVMGLFVGLMFAGMSSLISADTGDLGEFERLVFSGAAIGIAPVFYGVFGFLGGIISAALYNLISGWVGGIKVEIKQAPSVPGPVPSAQTQP